MDPYSAHRATGPPTRPDSRPGPSSRPLSQHRLSSRITSLSDFDGYDSFGYHQEPVHSSGASHPLRGRESLASLASNYSNSSYSSNGLPRKARLHADTSQSTILEEPGHERESIDMADLLHNASPIAGAASRSAHPYSPLAHDDHERHPSEQFDQMAYFGPTTSQDADFIKQLQKQEASGQLTLGIGAGFEPPTKVKESELLAAAAAAASASPIRGPEGGVGGTGAGAGAGLFRAGSLRRTFSKRGSYIPTSPISPMVGRPLDRQGTVKALGQNEANRRGQIVEVIMEEDEDDHKDAAKNAAKNDYEVVSKVDLSVMSGPTVSEVDVTGDRVNSSGSSSGGGKNGSNGSNDFIGGPPLLVAAHTLPTRKLKTHIFYPQPNWKPFSMRWPYLTMLIVLSAGLGVAEELIYRRSALQPLIEFHSPLEISGIDYFLVKFAPTIITVSFGVLWQITDFEVKRLEAFYQLSRQHGAAAEDSLNVDYVTYFAFFRPFRALARKHYAVALSSVTSLLAISVVPTLGAASVVLVPNRDERLANPGGVKGLVINPVWSRLLTSTLMVIAALGCVLFWLLQRRRTGLLSDVRGIAGLASMAVVSHILSDFKDMDVATHGDIHRKLRGRRYVLRNSALAPLDDEEEEEETEQAHEQDRSHEPRESPLSQNPHPLMLRALGCTSLVVGILVFAGLIPVALYVGRNASWVMTALAVCIKLGWGGLETSVRMMEPYYILSRRHAPAKTLTLDYTAMPFLWVAIQALINRHLLVFFVGLGTVMAEFLTVLVASLATVEGWAFVSGSGDTASSEETETSFWVTLGLVSFILSYMSVVAVVAFLRRRRPFLPRQPNTISSVLAYIHQSKMLYSFVATSKLSNAEMRRKLVQMEVTYGLGWFDGRDGQTHCGVDQEELTSSYKVGYDYSRSNQPWLEQPVEWL